MIACGSASDSPASPKDYAPTPLAPLADAPMTSDVVLVPTTPIQSYKDGPNPSSYVALADYEVRHFGDLANGPGQPSVTRVIDGTTPPKPGPGAKRIVRFAHLSDLQIGDDESPNRLALYDSADLTNAAARPQDEYLCRMTNAAVRTINALHRRDPLAFTIMGGDNADSAQDNELGWVLGMLSGSPSVKCDSGDVDDPIAGPDNDGKDPFVAEGLAMPWKWVTGNHDVLVLGTVKIDDGHRAAALGVTANGGTRNYASGGSIESGDFVVSDPRRVLMSRQDLIAKVAGDKDGHGLGNAERASGRATYSFDVDGTNLRFVVLDTCHEEGGSEGVIRQTEVDRVIKPLLDKAQADKKWVVLASHHAVASLTADGGALGAKEPDALLPDAWAKLVGGYPNVLFSLVGHSHRNQVKPIAPSSGHAWWEVMTAAIADYPHELRLVEIYDQDNGWLSMRATPVDFNAMGDPVAEEGRRRGVIDVTSGWLPNERRGAPEDRNVELWIKKP